ncbi:MAG TPA: hypothetical protein VHW01_16125 [Polyangiaceae bacterium]|nr:hypothetical protein [Polyangiaceae bacterium]
MKTASLVDSTVMMLDPALSALARADKQCASVHMDSAAAMLRAEIVLGCALGQVAIIAVASLLMNAESCHGTPGRDPR